jgi:hypothetical protein
MVVGPGGWLVLASGIKVVLQAASGLLQWRRCRGDGGGFGSAAGRVLMRAKAFTDVIVGGHDGGALGASLSLLGASWRGTMPSTARGSQGEDLVHLRICSGCALASYPPWRRCVWSLVPARGSGGCCLDFLHEASLVCVAVEVQRVRGC